MPKSIVKNYVDTPISGVTSLNLPMGLVNYGADFRVKANQPQEAVLTNLTSPVDAPEKFRIAISDIADVYKGTGIDPARQSASHRGVSLLVQLSDTWSVTDSADASFLNMLPISGHIVIKVPANENVTSTDIKAFVGRLVSGLFETGAVDVTRLNALLRGSLLPTDL